MLRSQKWRCLVGELLLLARDRSIFDTPLHKLIEVQALAGTYFPVLRCKGRTFFSRFATWRTLATAGDRKVLTCQASHRCELMSDAKYLRFRSKSTIVNWQTLDFTNSQNVLFVLFCYVESHAPAFSHEKM
jgi:hypothetical protein